MSFFDHIIIKCYWSVLYLFSFWIAGFIQPWPPLFFSWIMTKMDWGRMKQSPKTHLLHQIPKECQREHSQRTLTGKTTSTLKPHKYPLVPLFGLWKLKVLPEKTSSPMVMGSLMIYRLCGLLQTLTPEERKSQVKGWSPATEHLGVALWLEQEPLTHSGGQGGNSWHMRVVNVCNSYISAPRLLL